MTKSNYTTKYCSVPPQTIASGHDKVVGSFYAITAPHKVKIDVVVSSSEAQFFNTYCVNCNYYKSQADIVREMANKGLVARKQKVLDYCEHNQVCYGSVEQQKYCFAQNKPLDGTTTLEVELPYLMWVWSYKAKGKNIWRLYEVKDYTPGVNEEFTISPYLFPNVYSNPAGAICWRKSNGLNKTPKDLVEAYHTFFSTPFNTETTPPAVEDLTEYILNYNTEEDELSTPQVFTIHEGLTWFEQDCPETMMFTNDPNIISTFPKKVVANKPTLFATIDHTDNPTMFLVNVDNYQCIKTGKLKGKSPVKLLMIKKT